MRLGITSMKKYIPVIVTLGLGLSVLTSQVLFKSDEIKASPVKVRNKVSLHYENKYKEIFYIKNGKKVYPIKAKVVIVNFWASWCVPCLDEFPSLVEFSNRYIENKNIIVIGINTDEPASLKDAKKIIKKFKIDFPIVFDKKSDLVNSFNISAIPVSILFKDGKVIEVSNGAKDFIAEEFLEKIEALLK